MARLIQKRFFLPLLLLLLALPAGAQRKVSADVEIKTVAKGKLTTVTKSVYCTSNGRLVTLFRSPSSYYHVANTKGETKIYNPATNEVLSQYDPTLSSNGELIMLFLSGRIEDLGLGQFGYRAVRTEREDGYVKKYYSPADVQLPTVQIVFEDYLPIYCEYTTAGGALLSKKYLSDYQRHGRLMLPQRITDISYDERKDSSVVRTIYSNVRIDQDDPAFDFQVPVDAKPMKLDVQPR